MEARRQGDRREEVPLREHMDQRFTDLERRIDLTSQGLERRLEGMNELRAQIDKERGQYLSRTEFEAKYEALADRVRSVEQSVAKATAVAAFVGAVAGILSHVIKWP